MRKKALIVLSEGFEDIEAVAPIDVLNRVGVEVTVAALKPGPVKAAYGLTLVPDISIEQVHKVYDAIIFPGGKNNARHLADHPKVPKLVHEHNNAGRLVAAICAAPSHVLGEAAHILKGKRATGDPSFNDKLAASGAEVSNEAVTVDGNIITGMGPGAALPFALKIAEYLVGHQLPAGFAQKWQIVY